MPVLPFACVTGRATDRTLLCVQASVTNGLRRWHLASVCDPLVQILVSDGPTVFLGRPRMIKVKLPPAQLLDANGPAQSIPKLAILAAPATKTFIVPADLLVHGRLDPDASAL